MEVHPLRVRGNAVAVSSHFGTGPARDFVEARRYPRFKLETSICVYPRNRQVVRGYTVDISQSGISAILRDEIQLDEIVRLEFTVPDGAVEVLALVRQRHAFRYGFQFLESPSAQDLISRTCRQLAIEQQQNS